MAGYPPSERTKINAEVLRQYLGDVSISLLMGSTIPFFSPFLLDKEELIRKASMEAKSYGTISEAETNQQINYISAVMREANMAAAGRAAFYSSAQEDAQLEYDQFEREWFLKAKVIEGNTDEQKGMA